MVGEAILHYRILEEIGLGRDGRGFLTEDTNLNRWIKSL
jgi:hypothetical protein